MFKDCPELEPRGRYIVTPDSTPPVATTLLNNVSPEEVEKSISALNERADSLGLSPANAMFYFTPEERAKLGSTALLDRFETIAQSNGGAINKDVS